MQKQIVLWSFFFVIFVAKTISLMQIKLSLLKTHFFIDLKNKTATKCCIFELEYVKK